tara:strand:- start:92042 stop:92233 length:192 start_codon:yes stop_codon:yes gene_type:complete
LDLDLSSYRKSMIRGIVKLSVTNYSTRTQDNKRLDSPLKLDEGAKPPVKNPSRRECPQRIYRF